MSEENVIKNFNPDEIKTTKKKTNRKKKVIDKKSEPANVNPFDSEESIKPAESMFAPKIYPHKLVCGKHNYPNIKHINDDGTIYIRRFTMLEENLFKKLAQSYTLKKFFEVINKSIEGCVRSNIDIYKLSMIEQLNLFVRIYSLTFDGHIEQETKCENCEFTDKVDINIDKDVKTNYMTSKDFIIRDIKLTSYEEPFIIRIKYPTLEEQTIYIDEEVEWANKIKLMVDRIDNGLENGYQVKKDDYLDIITNINQVDKAKLKEFIKEITDNFGISFIVENKFVCENKKCNLYNKSQNVELDLETFFKNIVINIM